ncbi:MAG: thioredoxin family protein [Burkholderiales bacterium]|nr:thioredoxin family protein [Burkholderiales bacterium]
MSAHETATREAWLAARRALLEAEKDLMRRSDELARKRRALPWVKVTKPYVFEGPDGRKSLGDLFDGRSQLIVYHFMYGPDWKEGCPSCSFWADNFEGIPIHLAHRDATLVAVSRAPYATLAAYQRRMGWTFPWYSSGGSDFNFDFQVSYTPEQVASGEAEYNYRRTKVMEELPGISVFARDEKGDVYHTYSTYSRGLDMLNGAYRYMDLLPKGRDEDKLPWTMAWLRRHDQYED